VSYRLPDGHMIHLPLIHVEVTSENAILTTTALLDSGATMSFLPYEITEILGITPVKGVQIGVSTAGGACDFNPLRLKKLCLLFGGKPCAEFRNMRMLTPSPDKEDLPYIILGRDYVFKRFHVTFRENVRRFELNHHKYAIR
jgi:hypothetical protein